MQADENRKQLLQELCQPQIAMDYFVSAAQSGDPSVLRLAVRDLLAAGGGVYPHVELTKLATNADAAEPSGAWGQYRVGETNDASLPVDYRLTGILIGPPRVGSIVTILRLTRNGVTVPGVYQSTEVARVANGVFATLNSVYQLRFVSI